VFEKFQKKGGGEGSGVVESGKVLEIGCCEFVQCRSRLLGHLGL